MSSRQPVGFKLVRIGMLLMLLGAVVPGSASAAEVIEVSFAPSGAEQTFDVPPGVTSIRVIAIGGRGGRGGPNGAVGGMGGRVQGDISVTPGATLYIQVGGNGTNGAANSAGTGGFNGGRNGGHGTSGAGGGGGATDIRTISRSEPNTLASRLLIAGGGGGGGGGIGAGEGGNAATDGANGAAQGGGGGTQTSGGSGGIGGTNTLAGGSGALGAGGTGGVAIVGFVSTGGGGGGGGYYGGGGGASPTACSAQSCSDNSAGAGGGGGGSSFTGSASNVSLSVDTTGAPSLLIRYADTPSGTVSADVTIPTSAACLTLSVASVSFGTVALGAEQQPATPAVVVANCSQEDATLLARGTDASGPGAQWTLDDSAQTCNESPALPADRYHLDVDSSTLANHVRLSRTSKAVESMPGGSDTSHTLRISTACPGSSGGGETMSLQVTYLITPEE